MTENEAIEILSLSDCMKEKLPNLKEVYEIAVNAMKEVQQYRALGKVEFLADMKNHYIEVLSDLRQYQKNGTVEECREARERQRGKKPTLYGDFEDGKLLCPNCEEDLMDLTECGFNCCPYCGQAIDWSE